MMLSKSKRGIHQIVSCGFATDLNSQCDAWIHRQWNIREANTRPALTSPRRNIDLPSYKMLFEYGADLVAFTERHPAVISNIFSIPGRGKNETKKPATHSNLEVRNITEVESIFVNFPLVRTYSADNSWRIVTTIYRNTVFHNCSQ